MPYIWSLLGGFPMSHSESGAEHPYERQPAGRDQGAAGAPFRLRAPCLPQAISYDPADEEMAPIHLRMLQEPGRQLRRGESWVGHVIAWWAGPWGLGGQPEGWRRVVPGVALLSCEGELIRLFGWDAVDGLAAVVCHTRASDLAAGFDAHVRTGESPCGAHWWWILERLGPDGEIESEGISDGPKTAEGGAARPGDEPGTGGPPPAPEG